MHLAAIETFLAVVDTGNLNKAADQLNVTQSTVTARLDVLEQTLGQTLLVRSRKGAALTKAGFLFQRHAEVISRTWALSRRTTGLPNNYSGMISLMCEQGLWDAVGTGMVRSISGHLQTFAIEAWPGTLSQGREWLESGLVDAAITEEQIGGTGLETRKLPPERIIQVASVARHSVPWHTDYIYVDHGPAFRRWHSTTWPEAETPRFTFGEQRWALSHILKQGGSAYLSSGLASMHIGDGDLFPVEGSPDFVRESFFTWRRDIEELHPWLSHLQPAR